MVEVVRSIRWPELRWFYALAPPSVKVYRYAPHRGFNVTERVVYWNAANDVRARFQDDALWTCGLIRYADASPFPHVRLEVRDTTRMGGRGDEFWYPAWVAGVRSLGAIAPVAFRRAVMHTTPAFREDVSRVWTLSGDPGAVLALLQATLPEDAWVDGTPFVGNAPL